MVYGKQVEDVASGITREKKFVIKVDCGGSTVEVVRPKGSWTPVNLPHVTVNNPVHTQAARKTRESILYPYKQYTQVVAKLRYPEYLQYLQSIYGVSQIPLFPAPRRQGRRDWEVMGQSQSSAAGGNNSTPAADNDQIKSDYYELLGLDRTATEEEIKKAYKKKALEYHPDRNYGNVEASTAIFAQIQAAYEVLSDPQERAWYDSHREAILSGHDTRGDAQYSHNTKMTTADDITHLIMKFNPRMEFSDAPSGFFGGLRETFEQLAREEELTCQWDGLDPVDYPSFGHKDDDYDSIRLFYLMWSGFATKKSFSWKDVYRYSEAPDRRIRRLMEKENKRLRDEAIREFNDAVRSLVAFVKKRDPRFKANVQNEAERQKSLRDAAAAQAARSRAANEAKLQTHQVPEWAQSEGLDEEMFSGSESEIEEEFFECVVCRKSFKSEKQFDVHERSKKHIKAVKQLKREMRTEDKHIQQLGINQGTSTTPSIGDKNTPITAPQENYEPLFEIADDEPEIMDKSASQDLDDRTDRYSISNLKINEAKTEIQTQEADEAEDDTSNTDEDYAPREVLEQRITTDTTMAAMASVVDDLNENMSKASTLVETNDDKNGNSTAPKVGKAKQKRAKRAAQAATEEQKDGNGKTFTCATCQRSFPSNSKLFSHIKALNHAQPVPRSNKQFALKGTKKGTKR
ncbi:hypothetical protein PAAG_08921 [Paracoccidioides lutzii Pb01]|uniref:Meiotically up-regulated gene 185 protein n=1 Tax=Paracoccidioides lutzii (strain ATCC MYA-826 / Pb01) TaxID=502779 RepID=C1HDS8_PARBA|nr:hypothetical protein PAAG_08921 [Paracoccidioides lutzii Pb01]EEH40072.2 hypothetical protein PAAG_08921 [Paracoccidioides lutzii Pb01]